MKDYILENRDLISQRELLQLSMETANNRIEISKINSDMISLEKQISDVAEGLKDVVTKSELADMMNSFISDDDEKWLMFNAKFSSADEVYESKLSTTTSSGGLILALQRAITTARPEGRYRKHCYWLRYKAVLLESSLLESSACSLIYFCTASSVILPIVST